MINEFDLIDQITQKIKINNKHIFLGPGDDAAVIKKNKKAYELYTCDCLVENVHFLRKFSTPQQIGQKAIAVNVSDIAAMGGNPRYCLVSLFLPSNTTAEYALNLADGLLSEAKKYHITIVGGNMSKGAELIVDITMIGEVNSAEVLTRRGARQGDLVCVTGKLGDAATGLKLLYHGGSFNSHQKKLISRQLTPTPRLKEAAIIAKSHLATSMIDMSDGLSSDILHICEQSKTGVELWVNDELALTGGEDYELLFTVHPNKAELLANKIKKQTGTQVTIIGKIIPQKEGNWFIGKNKKRKPLTARGWNHFS